MPGALSDRLLRVVDALPLGRGLRVLEIGGAPGAAAREVAARIGPSGHVLVLDRSATGVAATERACSAQIAAGLISTLCAEVEEFELEPDVRPFDLAFGCRVGVLDGRHPKRYDVALTRIRRALTPQGRLYVDTGDPLLEIRLH